MTTPNPFRRAALIVAAVLLGFVLVGAVLLTVAVEVLKTRRAQRAKLDQQTLVELAPVDQQVSRDVEAALVRRLRAGNDDEIARFYGRFKHLAGAGISRPRTMFGPNSSLQFKATAFFEKARADVGLVVHGGTTVRVTRLGLNPSEETLRYDLRWDGMEVIDGEIRGAEMRDSRDRLTLWGEAEHPAYVHYVQGTDGGN